MKGDMVSVGAVRWELLVRSECLLMLAGTGERLKETCSGFEFISVFQL